MHVDKPVIARTLNLFLVVPYYSVEGYCTLRGMEWEEQERMV